jgi:YidC/Oxa1 family membrane protein insertase
MDRKQLVTGISLSMAVFVGWFALTTFVNKKYGVAKDEKIATPVVSPTTAPVFQSSTQSTTSSAGLPAPQFSTGLRVIESGDAAIDAPAKLGSEAKNYAMQLATTSAGASIHSVTLNDFLASVEDKEKKPYSFQHPDPAVATTYGNPLATRSITIDGTTIDLSKTFWKREDGGADPGRAVYSITLGQTPGVPEVKVLKTYRVFARDSKEHPGLGYEIRVDYDFENRSDRPLSLSLSYNGPATPPRELANGPDQRVMAGYRIAANTNIEVENHYIESFADEYTTRDVAVNEDKVPMYWAGVSSVYFQAIVMPPILDNGTVKSSSIASFKAIGLNPELHEQQPLALVIDTTAMAVAPNQRLNYPISVFFGPKWRHVLNDPFYSSVPRDYDQTLVVRAGPCSVCTFDWLINILVVMLGFFHTITRDWGLAIICLVILVRLMLHPITKRSQVSMMKMGKMGPEMERLRKKYADDKEALQKAMWEFQKQQGITPVLGCLPMFLQMPIWIALWSALNTTFELRHSKFLWGFTWIDDLAKPDRLIPLTGVDFRIPLIGVHVDAINLLPFLLAVVFYLQQKFTPKPPTMSKEQEQQQKIMQGMMVFLFPLFLYGQPSGLNLYILTSTAIGIWESKRIRKHIKEKEEAEKAGLVIVDADPPKGGGKVNRDAPAAPSPQGWLARKLSQLQAKADQARQSQPTPKRRGGRDRA